MGVGKLVKTTVGILKHQDKFSGSEMLLVEYFGNEIYLAKFYLESLSPGEWISVLGRTSS